MAGINALILAAGQASRFGSDKRQVTGPWTGPLLHHVLSLYRPHFGDLGVVIGDGDAFGEQACKSFAATALINTEPHRGMGRSLAVGMDWLIERGADGVVIGLADMPWIAADTIEMVKTALRSSAQPVAPCLSGDIGFPRGIPASYFAGLRVLDGDGGASAVIDWRGALLLPCHDDGILRDIDRPGDI